MGFFFVLTSIRNSEEIVKVARIEIYGFMAWLRGTANNSFVIIDTAFSNTMLEIV
jgi:hypothetical protein